jgi:integral membrane sensor domain MASE1/PAS domain-containing protein
MDATSSTLRWSLKRGIVCALAIAAGYFLAQIGAALLRPPNRVTAMWLPLGVMLGVCLTTAPRNWRYVAMGALLGGTATFPMLFHDYPLWCVLALAALAFLPASVTAWLVQKVPSQQILSWRRLLILVVAGLPITWLLLVLPATLMLVAVRPDLPQMGFSTLLAWNSASGAAVLTLVAPAIVSMIERLTSARQFRPARVAEAMTRWFLVIAAAFGAYWFDTGSGYPEALQFLPLPLLLWSAIRFKLPGVAVDLFTISFIAFAGAAHGLGPLGHASSDARMFIMQLNFAALGVPMLFLAAVVAERAEAEKQIAMQLRFEQLASAVSSAMANCNASNLTPQLADVLEKIAVAMDADRVVFAETERDTSALVARAHYRRSDPPFPDRLIISDRYPHLWNALQRGQVSNIPDVQRLGDEAAADREHFQEVGIRSQLTIPVMDEGRLSHVLAIASRRPAAWRESQIPGVRVLAEALATAAQRCVAEEDLRLTQYAVDRNPAMILRIDMDGRFLYANEAACNQLGYSPAELQRMYVLARAMAYACPPTARAGDCQL